MFTPILILGIPRYCLIIVRNDRATPKYFFNSGNFLALRTMENWRYFALISSMEILHIWAIGILIKLKKENFHIFRAQDFNGSHRFNTGPNSSHKNRLRKC